MKFKIVLEPSGDGGFTVYVPSLTGCICEGDSVEKAIANIHESIQMQREAIPAKV